MRGRRHGKKPTLALWMLIAVADLAILVAATSVLTMTLIVVALAVVAGGVVAASRLTRRAEPVVEVARRRA
jgi:hypothetical protein